MSWWDSFMNSIKSIFAWLSSDETQAQIESIVDFVISIIAVVGSFNDEPSNEMKREYGRGILRFFVNTDIETLERGLALKKSGALDKIESHDLDAILGVTIAKFIKEKNNIEKKGSGKTKRKGKDAVALVRDKDGKISGLA